jgi:N-carbamoyl-L-amino-acid hydrolase
LSLNRFQKDFCAIAQFGVLGNGGVTRLAFSKEDMDARNYLIQGMRDAGLEVSIDPVGNIRGVRAGTNPDLAPVVMGSHLDTVPHGGHYDGVVGVLAALEIVRRLNEAEIKTEHPIEIINFSAEESSRFGMATIGSKAIAGKLDVSDIQQLTDFNGENLYKILSNSGHDVDALPQAVLKPGDFHAFIELHIEQGPVLENEQLDVGIVTAIAAPSRFRIHVQGRSDHSGNTPMAMRRDALAGASEIVLGVEALVQQAGEHTVGTVGECHVHPGAMNVIPGSVELSVDIRDTNADSKQIAVDGLKELVTQIAERRQLKIKLTELCDDMPVQLNSSLVEQLCSQARQLQMRFKRMVSGAGHDAMHMADIGPTAMIFIPSIEGVSHNIEEKSSLSDIEEGIRLAHQFILEMATEAK